MKEGDVVRFAMWDEVFPLASEKWHTVPKPYIGSLIEHDKLMGTVTLLYEGEILKLRSVFVEKAGKKDCK